MKIRVGHDILIGNSTLTQYKVIDIYSDSIVGYDVEAKDTKLFPLVNLDAENAVILDNGIDQPETQDAEGSYSVISEGEVHDPPWSIGSKVAFSEIVGGASLEITGFIVRNFWKDCYLLTEQGVSVPDRYWKVSHCKCRIV